MQAALNFSPGVSVFILDPVSFNVSFGVFGFYLKKRSRWWTGKDQETDSRQEQISGSIFSILISVWRLICKQTRFRKRHIGDKDWKNR